MRPIKFKENNKILTASDCGDLPVFSNDEMVVSCWKMTLKERLISFFTGKIWLGVKSNSGTQAPVWLDVENPFIVNR